jgi:putative thioredoxin
MNTAAYIFEGTAENFSALVLDNSTKGPVVVYYWASWAGPCHKFWPVLEKVTMDYGGKFLLVSINTDQQKQLARDQGVNSVPTLKLYRHRKVVEELHGPQPAADLRKAIAKYIARASDAKLAAAIRSYQEGNIEEAVTLLREAEVADPDNIRIPLTLAKLLMRHGQVVEAENLLGLLPAETQEDPEVSTLLTHLGLIRVAQGVPDEDVLEQAVNADPKNLEARYQLAALKLMRDDYAGALQQLLAIVRQDRSFRKDAGRKAMIAVLNLLGKDDDIARRYRALMFNALH